MAPQHQHEQQCLYDVLGVERSASIDEIRSAYRKLALKWHPDKSQQIGASPEECQEATVRFQEIGRAYEVLSDPSERAWYDSHRFEILSASSRDFPFGAAASSDFEFSLWSYFSPAAFSGYGETGLGFYAVYTQAFQKLDQQEKAFVRAYGGPSVPDAPLLGGLGIPYSQVASFYSYWLGFSTVKDFSWCDEYKTTQASNRKVRRLMEEENKKLRRKARREFNETVRQLAAFVKKRDKRVMERLLEVQRLQNEKELMLKLRRKQAEEEKLRKARQFQEAEWTRVSNVESASGDEHGIDEDENWGRYEWDRSQRNGKGIAQKSQEELYCIICNKKFKSEKQWKNHEKSKKHVDRAALLNDAFAEDEGEGEENDLKDLLSKRDSDWIMNEVERKQSSNESIRFYTGTALSEEENAGPYTGDPTRPNQCNTYSLMGTSKGEPESGSEDRENEASMTDDESSFLLAMLESQKNREQGTLGQRSNLQDASDATDNSEDEALASTLNSYSRKLVEDVNEGQEGEALYVDVDTTSVLMGGHARGDEQSGCLESNSPNKRQSQSVQSEMAAAMIGSHAHPSEMASLEQSFESLNTEGTAGERRVTVLFSKETVRDDAGGEVFERVEAKNAEKLQTEGHNLSSRQSRPSKESRVTNKFSATQVDQGRKQMKGRRIQGKASSNKCETCGEEFDSRNQLFKHVKAVNHSVLRTRHRTAGLDV